MMRLHDKQALFLGAGLRPDRLLDEAAQKAASIVLGPLKGVLFEEGSRLESPALTAPQRVFMGAHSYMNAQGYVRSNVFVGRFCSIGRRVTIGAGGHRMTGLSTSPTLWTGRHEEDYSPEEVALLGIARPGPVGQATLIGSDVWIGDGAVILPGVSIGPGAVIGANAVVTRDVPAYAVMGGIPARMIRTRFAPSICQKLLDSAWWDIPLKRLKTLPLGHVPRLLQALEDIPERPGYPTLALA